MCTKKIPAERLDTYQQSNDSLIFSKDVRNWKSVLHVHSKRKQVCLEEIQCHLRKYFADHMFIIDRHDQMNDFIDQQAFEEIIQSAGFPIDKITLESLWNSCQPSDKGITRQVFRQHFAPSKLENNQSTDSSIRISNYTTLINHTIKNHWQDLKADFVSLDRYGRLIITIDQAINLMRKYSFPLNEKQQCELALLFSPKNNGQFHYFDFMQVFTIQSSWKNYHPEIFSRSTYPLQSKQSWSVLFITIDDILHRIRLQCILKYESIHRMFQKIDRNRQEYLTKIQFNQLLEQFDIHLNKDEFYHLMSEIDKNQDGILTYDELYYSLITDLLQI